MMVMDAWTFIPFMMIMILAALQAIPKELHEPHPAWMAHLHGKVFGKSRFR